MNAIVSSAIKDWIPYRLKETGNGALCEWLYLGDTDFDKPFFDETISKCKSLPENSTLKKSVSDITILEEWVLEIEKVPPTAIIFHVSRCGSTLLSQLLATDLSNIVLSEVPFLDEILQMGFSSGDTKSIYPLFKSSVGLYGAKRKKNQQHLFIKADSWHIHFYKELREMYPQIPFFFLYRRPDEVIRSHQKHRGMHAVPGVIPPAIFGFDAEIANSTNLDAYTSKVLETYYIAISNILAKDTLAFGFDYQEGIIHVIQTMLTKCGISTTEEQLHLMAERSSHHSKFPGQVFAEEAITNAPPDYMEKAFQLYHELTNHRLIHRPTS